MKKRGEDEYWIVEKRIIYRLENNPFTGRTEVTKVCRWAETGCAVPGPSQTVRDSGTQRRQYVEPDHGWPY